MVNRLVIAGGYGLGRFTITQAAAERPRVAAVGTETVVPKHVPVVTEPYHVITHNTHRSAVHNLAVAEDVGEAFDGTQRLVAIRERPRLRRVRRPQVHDAPEEVPLPAAPMAQDARPRVPPP